MLFLKEKLLGSPEVTRFLFLVVFFSVAFGYLYIAAVRLEDMFCSFFLLFALFGSPENRVKAQGI